MKKLRTTIYECRDGYLIHDADHHTVYIYETKYIEKVYSNKTVHEVWRQL